MSELPQGWALACISDLADINPKQDFDDHLPAGFVPMSHAPTNFRDKLRFEERNWGEIKKAYTNFKDGDVIFAKVTPCFENGKAALVEEMPSGIAAGSSEFYVLRPSSPEVSAKYLLALVKSRGFMREGAENMTGAVGLRRVPKKFVESYPVLVPPAAEQTRIAQKLDELLAQVDTLKARIDAIPALLKRFRQSVLAAAVSGRLTEEWRGGADSCPLTQPPLVFFERDQGSIPNDWRWSMLVKLAVLESGHTPRKSISAYWENGDVPWISLQDIRAADGKEIFETKHMPTMLGIENSSARLLPAETVCFSRDISVGFVTIMGRSMATTQHFANWVCKDELLPKYLMYAFMAGREHLLRSGQGSTVKTIYMPALKELRLLLPPLAEQTEIVRRVEQLFAFADQLEAKVASAKSRIDHLTQSILTKAFRGELVPQDPNDEPASVLLQRIKAQRAAEPKAKAKRGRKASA